MTDNKAEEKSGNSSTADRDEKPAEDKKPGTEKSSESGGKESGKDADKKPAPSTGEIIRKRPLLTLTVLAVLIAAAAGGFVWWSNARQFESTDDAFISGRQFTVSPKVSGYITSVTVNDNRLVAPGETLIEIDDRDYKTSLSQAEAQVAQAEASIPNIDAQIAGQQAQIVQSETQIADAKAQLDLAVDEDNRYQQLANTGSGTVQRAQQTRASLLQARAALSRANAGLNAAQKQLAALQAQRLSSEANVAQTKAQRDQAKINIDYTVVKADQGGHVVQLTAAKGQFIQAGQSLMVIVPDPLWIVANFRETQIEDMRPGQPVDIRIDAYSNRKFRGHVDSVQSGSGTAFSLLPVENATGNYVKVVQRVPVKIVLDERPDVVIGPGMSVLPKVRVR